jgi:hypothetical protein
MHPCYLQDIVVAPLIEQQLLVFYITYAKIEMCGTKKETSGLMDISKCRSNGPDNKCKFFCKEIDSLSGSSVSKSSSPKHRSVFSPLNLCLLRVGHGTL